MVRFWKATSAFMAAVLVLTIVMPVFTSGTVSASSAGSSTNEGMWIYFFYGNGCPHCALVEPLIENLAAKYPQVNFIKLEVWYNSANNASWQDFNRRYEVKNPAIPSVFIADLALIREDPIKNNLESSIQYIISTNNTISPLRYSVAEAAIKNAHPRVNFTTLDGAVFNSSQVTIFWNYSGGQSNVTSVETAIDGGNFSSIASSDKSYVATGLSDGNHTLVLRITDENGLSSEHSLNFTVVLESQSDLGSASSNPLPIGLAIFVLITGLLLVFVQRTRRKT